MDGKTVLFAGWLGHCVFCVFICVELSVHLTTPDMDWCGSQRWSLDTDSWVPASPPLFTHHSHHWSFSTSSSLPGYTDCHWRTFKLNLPIKVLQKEMTKKQTNTNHVPRTAIQLCLLCLTMPKTSVIYGLKGALFYHQVWRKLAITHHFKIVIVTSPVGVSS